MAITWGSAQSAGDNGFRLGYEFTQSPSTVTSSTSSVTVTLRLYVGTRRSVYDSTNTFSRSGSWGSSSSSVDISHSSSSSWSSANVTQVYSGSISVATSTGGSVSRSFSASLSGINAIGGTASVSGTHTVPERPSATPDAPNAPTGVSATYLNDNLFTVNWTNNSLATKPWNNVIVQRWDVVTAGWYTIATLAGTATGYVDRTTVGNHRYRWRVFSRNTGGSSGVVHTANFSTTPLSPSSTTAYKSGADIVVSWERRDRAASHYFIQRRQNEGSWINVGSVGNVDEWVHVAPSTTVTHQYQVRAVANLDGQNFTSEYKLTGVVQLDTPPAAPTALTPNGTTLNTDLPITFEWQHNSIDTSGQQGYGLRYRQNGGAWTTLALTTSSVSSRTLAAGTFPGGTVVDWEVRTRGAHASYGPYSATATFTMSDPPSTTITYPSSGTPVATARITATWSYYDAESTTQSGYQVQLYTAGGTLLESRSGSGSATSRALTTLLANGSNYQLRVRIQDGSGLWSEWATENFSVAYPLPPAASVQIYWTEEIAANQISITNPTPGGGQAAAVSNELWRSLDGETYELVADNLQLNTTVTDYIPTLAGFNTYLVVSVSALGAAQMSTPVTEAAPDSHQWFWLNGGDSFATLIKLRYNPSRSRSFSRGKSLNNYAGRPYPVETAGEHRTREFNLSFSVLEDDDSTLDAIEAFADLPAPLCLRTPGGLREFVSIEGVSTSGSGGPESLSFKLVQVAPPDIPTMLIPSEGE